MYVIRCDVCKQEPDSPSEIATRDAHDRFHANPVNEGITLLGKTIDIGVRIANDSTIQHLCYACMWKEVKELVARHGPADTDSERTASSDDVSEVQVEGDMQAAGFPEPPFNFISEGGSQLHQSPTYQIHNGGFKDCLFSVCSTWRSTREDGGQEERPIRGASRPTIEEGVEDSWPKSI